jgi:uncharacterized membrane protein
MEGLMQPDMQSNASREMQTPALVARVVRKLENERRLDPIVERLRPLVEPLAREPNGAALRGEWLGHALHPLLTDLPLGCWLSAGLLDVVGGRSSRKAAQRLVGVGLLLVPVTAASGAVDWQAIDDPRNRRVGVVHAVSNTAVALCYLRSWNARRRGHYQRGKLWGLAGGTLAWGSGYLGGHLSFGRGVGQGLRGLKLDQPPRAMSANNDTPVSDLLTSS